MTSRIACIGAWATASAASAVAYAYATVYWIGTVDPAYGDLASFQMLLMLALSAVFIGAIGFTIGLIMSRAGVSISVALSAGLVFAVMAWLCGMMLGEILPNRDVTVIACLLWLVAGAMSLFLVPKRAG
jgi:hypothetical protein